MDIIKLTDIRNGRVLIRTEINSKVVENQLIPRMDAIAEGLCSETDDEFMWATGFHRVSGTSGTPAEVREFRRQVWGSLSFHSEGLPIRWQCSRRHTDFTLRRPPEGYSVSIIEEGISYTDVTGLVWEDDCIIELKKNG